MKDIEKNNLPTTTATEQNASEDSVIIYRSWFECLLALGKKKFFSAIIALLSYAFYGTRIEDAGLPLPLEKLVQTFIPVIDSNRRNRQNGKKGGQYGSLGGRPTKNPGGVSATAPNGVTSRNPNGNGNGKGNGTNMETVSVEGTPSGAEAGQPASAHHTDASVYLDIFFFRNLRQPEQQAEKFVNHYAILGWKLTGGDTINTVEQRRALAKRWEVRDDPAGRFHEDDLAMWHALFDIAPPEVRPLMLDRGVAFVKKTGQKSKIGCPAPVVAWIEQNLGITAPIILPWTNNLGVTYAPYDVRSQP